MITQEKIVKQLKNFQDSTMERAMRYDMFIGVLSTRFQKMQIWQKSSVMHMNKIRDKILQRRIWIYLITPLVINWEI